MTPGPRIPFAAVLGVLGALSFAACGDDDEKIKDERIIEALDLQRIDSGLAIQGDPFCTVDEKLLNDADEVADALDEDELGIVVASGEGNAGIEGVPPFSRECRQRAKDDLNKLDPKPKED